MTDIKQFICEKCKQPFKSRQGLHLHSKKCEGIQEYECGFCNRKFIRKHHYENHMKNQHESELDLNQNSDEKQSENVVKKCKFCSSTFSCNEEYLSHLQTHKNNPKTPFMCSECGKQYRVKQALNLHIKSRCGIDKLFKCNICSKELKSAGSLYTHMIRHKGTKKYMCRFCAKQFFTGGQLHTHERIHTQEKVFICEVCNKGFCHRESLITHSSLHTGIKPYQCENCGNSFSCVGNLIKHRRTHADTCGLVSSNTHRVKNDSTKLKVRINTPNNIKLKKIERSKALDREVEDVKTELALKKVQKNVEIVLISKKEYDIKVNESNIDDNENNFEDCDEKLKDFSEEIGFDKNGFGNCKYCGKKYTNIRWMFRHVLQHEKITEIDKKPCESAIFKCSFCNVSFDTKIDLQNHQQISHTDSLTCPESEKPFTTKEALHLKTLQKNKSRKNYTYICEKCGKQFKQRSYLTTHESKNCQDGPYFPCHLCNKHFSSKYTRKSHMQTHNEKKKFTCKFCGKSFHWKGQLKIHERGHTGEKPYACLYCPKKFPYRESLLTHSTLHTGIKPYLCEACGGRFSCIGNLIKHRKSHKSCADWMIDKDNHKLEIV